MATIQVPLGAPTIRSPQVEPGETITERFNEDEDHRGETKSGPPVLVIAAYFVGLASIAVVAVGGQFPWFTVAPATVLSLIAYFRHVEAKLDHESSS
jgi:hypothetical protein